LRGTREGRVKNSSVDEAPYDKDEWIRKRRDLRGARLRKILPSFGLGEARGTEMKNKMEDPVQNK